ncbi:MAG: hypothetical protein RJA70_4018 [Pseudomonadota bacterium]|jgi:hypothetical protein
MFALPGILALTVFLMGRPFDLIPQLQGVPLLYIFCGIAALGFVADIRVGFNTIPRGHQLALVMLFFGWCLLTVLIRAAHTLVPSVTTITILFVVYLLIAHGIRSFRGFEFLAGTLLACSIWVSLACIHLAYQPMHCVTFAAGETDIATPDDRTCTTNDECTGDERTRCEHVGAFGMTTVNQRVRYVGTLRDPNEVALFVSTTLPFAVAFYQRRRSKKRLWLVLTMIPLTAYTVFLSQSRGGMIVLVAVLLVFAVNQFGLRKTLLTGLPLAAIAAMVGLAGLIGGDERADADASTQLRIECMRTGMHLFLNYPASGVGFEQFTQYHGQTAHNSYILTAAETGIPGMVLWTSVCFLALKNTWNGLRKFVSPEAEVAQIWGRALTTSMVGMAIGILFLSLSYEYLLWVFLALCGAYVEAVRAHAPTFDSGFSVGALVKVLAGIVLLLSFLAVYTGAI